MQKKRYTRPVAITVEEDMYTRMLKITDAREISISEYVRDAINLLLEKEERGQEVTTFIDRQACQLNNLPEEESDDGNRTRRC